jgi:hypothetical protein
VLKAILIGKTVQLEGWGRRGASPGDELVHDRISTSDQDRSMGGCRPLFEEGIIILIKPALKSRLCGECRLIGGVGVEDWHFMFMVLTLRLGRL